MKKVALVTGASRGIGQAISIELAKNGYLVVVNYLKSEEKAKNVANLIESNGGNAITYKCDVSNAKQVNTMIDYIVKAFGKLDVVINNAGLSAYNLICDITDEEWNSLVATNLTGTFNVCRSASKVMVQNKCGKIINISSMWGITGASMEVHYSATKAGVIGLTKALAKELAPSGITVNCVAPGAIETDMMKELTLEQIEAVKQETPLGKLGSPEDIAKVVNFLASDDANFITGQVISPNGGMVI